MKKNKGVLIIALVVLAIFTSLYFDSKIVKGISLIRNSSLNEFFIGITFISSWAIVLFFLVNLFLWQEHKRKWIIPLCIAFCLSAAVSFLLKISLQRQRPFQLGIVSILPVLEKSNYLTWNFSFPSFQTMLGFCVIPILSKEFPRLKYIWILFALIVAFSRLYFGLHFLSDIIAGALIGYLIGWIVVKIEIDKRFGKKVWKKVFSKQDLF